MQRRFLHVDDSKTWNAFLEGNQAAFEFIYQTHFQALYNYGKKFSKDEALIGDTLQQLFTDLWQKRGNLGSTNQIKNYLYAAFRRSLLRNQKRSNHPSLLGESSFEITLSHEAHLIQQQHAQEQMAALQQAINGLTESQREVIYLKFYDGLSYTEISEIMGINAAQVYDFMYKALRSLRKDIRKPDTLDSLTHTAFTLTLIHQLITFLP